MEVNWHLLDNIYLYFGGKIALYFGFLAHTTGYTLVPGLIGIPVFVNAVLVNSWEPVRVRMRACVCVCALCTVGSRR